MQIDLNIDDIINEFNLPTNLGEFIITDSVDKVTVEIYRNWSLLASKELNSTRNEYLNNLQVLDISKFSKSIVLTGKLPNMIESGCSPFDMKEGFSKSSKVKYSYKTDKNGNVTASWYLTIPFRFATPGAIGENSAFSGVMPQDIHDTMQSKPAGESLKKSEISSPYDIPSSRKAITLPTRVIPEYTHKSSIYAGMVKKTAAYGSTNQNSYVTFRRVSENSDQDAWIHKGMEAKDFMTKAINASNVQDLVENNVDLILKNLGYGK